MYVNNEKCGSLVVRKIEEEEKWQISDFIIIQKHFG